MTIAAENQARQVYGLSQPTLADARDMLRGSESEHPTLWQELLTEAGLSGSETTPAALASLSRAMIRRGGTVGLYGTAVHIRSFSHKALTSFESVLTNARV